MPPDSTSDDSLQAVVEAALTCARMCGWDWNVVTGEDRFFGDTLSVFGRHPGPDYSSFRELVHPDDLSHLEEVVQEAARSHQIYEGEFRVVHPDGSVHWIFARGKFFYDINGNPVRMVGIDVDITEIKQKDAELSDARAGLDAQRNLVETIVQNIPVMLCYMREPGKVHWVNRAWEAILGWTSQDNDGNLAPLLYPDPADAARVRQFIAAASGEWGEFATQTKSRGRIDTEFLNVSLKDGINIGIGRDVTAQKRAISDLRESEKRFRMLADHIPQLVWIADASGATKYYNQRWYDFTGQSPAQAEDFGWIAVMHTDDIEPNQRIWEASAKAGTEFQNELRIRRRDGEFCWFLIRAIPVRDEISGQIVSWFGTSTDISERKQAEQALIRAEKLATAGRFAATIAHEVNNPLAAITNIHFLLASDETLPQNVRDMLQVADNELRRVSQILRQTLAFYREQTRVLPTKVADLVDETIHLFSRRFENRSISLDVDISGTLTISAIPGELRQVLCNLVANSLDATPNGGRISLRAHLSNCKGVPLIRVTVADTGSGIQPEHLHHIFEPFFTTKDNYGTGLGLWVTSELIRRNQGEIRVRSRVGRGTVFTLLLPVAFPESYAFAEAMTDSLITSGPSTDLANAASIPLPIDVAQQGESATLPLIKPVSTDTMDA